MSDLALDLIGRTDEEGLLADLLAGNVITHES